MAQLDFDPEYEDKSLSANDSSTGISDSSSDTAQSGNSSSTSELSFSQILLEDSTPTPQPLSASDAVISNPTESHSNEGTYQGTYVDPFKDYRAGESNTSQNWSYEKSIAENLPAATVVDGLTREKIEKIESYKPTARKFLPEDIDLADMEIVHGRVEGRIEAERSAQILDIKEEKLTRVDGHEFGASYQINNLIAQPTAPIKETLASTVPVGVNDHAFLARNTGAQAATLNQLMSSTTDEASYQKGQGAVNIAEQLGSSRTIQAIQETAGTAGEPRIVKTTETQPFRGTEYLSSGMIQTAQTVDEPRASFFKDLKNTAFLSSSAEAPIDRQSVSTGGINQRVDNLAQIYNTSEGLRTLEQNNTIYETTRSSRLPVNLVSGSEGYEADFVKAKLSGTSGVGEVAGRSFEGSGMTNLTQLADFNIKRTPGIEDSFTTLEYKPKTLKGDSFPITTGQLETREVKFPTTGTGGGQTRFDRPEIQNALVSSQFERGSSDMLSEGFRSEKGAKFAASKGLVQQAGQEAIQAFQPAETTQRSEFLAHNNSTFESLRTLNQNDTVFDTARGRRGPINIASTSEGFEAEIVKAKLLGSSGSGEITRRGFEGSGTSNIGQLADLSIRRNPGIEDNFRTLEYKPKTLSGEDFTSGRNALQTAEIKFPATGGGLPKYNKPEIQEAIASGRFEGGGSIAEQFKRTGQSAELMANVSDTMYRAPKADLGTIQQIKSERLGDSTGGGMEFAQSRMDSSGQTFARSFVNSQGPATDFSKALSRSSFAENIGSSKIAAIKAGAEGLPSGGTKPFGGGGQYESTFTRAGSIKPTPLILGEFAGLKASGNATRSFAGGSGETALGAGSGTLTRRAQAENLMGSSVTTPDGRQFKTPLTFDSTGKLVTGNNTDSGLSSPRFNTRVDGFKPAQTVSDTMARVPGTQNSLLDASPRNAGTRAVDSAIAKSTGTIDTGVNTTGPRARTLETSAVKPVVTNIDAAPRTVRAIDTGTTVTRPINPAIADATGRVQATPSRTLDSSVTVTKPATIVADAPGTKLTATNIDTTSRTGRILETGTTITKPTTVIADAAAVKAVATTNIDTSSRVGRILETGITVTKPTAVITDAAGARVATTAMDTGAAAVKPTTANQVADSTSTPNKVAEISTVKPATSTKALNPTARIIEANTNVSTTAVKVGKGFNITPQAIDVGTRANSVSIAQIDFDPRSIGPNARVGEIGNRVVADGARTPLNIANTIKLGDGSRAPLRIEGRVSTASNTRYITGLELTMIISLAGIARVRGNGAARLDGKLWTVEKRGGKLLVNVDGNRYEIKRGIGKSKVFLVKMEASKIQEAKLSTRTMPLGKTARPFDARGQARELAMRSLLSKYGLLNTGTRFARTPLGAGRQLQTRFEIPGKGLHPTSAVELGKLGKFNLNDLTQNQNIDHTSLSIVSNKSYSGTRGFSGLNFFESLANMNLTEEFKSSDKPGASIEFEKWNTGRYNLEDEELASKLDPEENIEEEDSQNGKALAPTLRRQIYYITEGDTLTGIARNLYNDADIGWLIADLNKHVIKETYMDGKRICELSNRQAIELPVFHDVQEFYENRKSDHVASGLVTIVTTRQIDQEVIDNALGPVLGYSQKVSCEEKAATDTPTITEQQSNFFNFIEGKADIGSLFKTLRKQN